ncbi:hypothetical protein ACFX2F_009709 [Malus domestica]
MYQKYCLLVNVCIWVILTDRLNGSLTMELPSIGTLDQQGYYHHIGEGKLKLTKGLMVVARAQLCCTLYRPNANVLKCELNVVEDSSLDLWHKRLGHMSEKGLQVMAKKSHISFAKDVCGSMEVESLGRNKYFVTYIDDASRRVWVFLLKSKDQVFQTFQEFHATVERETGKPLKCLHSNNDDEYTFHQFREYRVKHGIRHKKTVPGTL